VVGQVEQERGNGARIDRKQQQNPTQQRRGYATLAQQQQQQQPPPMLLDFSRRGASPQAYLALALASVGLVGGLLVGCARLRATDDDDDRRLR
jgi:DNA-binding GntR family transcriptional regulator